jgi:histidinol-phosphate/aromatic aminotransferase/cobyric acid decarboxylase-like protein/GNAT superfamily N-acetyltransferase
MTTLLSAPEISRRDRTARFPRIQLSVATSRDRESIYRFRYEVYADELRQYTPGPTGELRDRLDDFNHYLVAKIGGEIAGFISITPPSKNEFSIDKYFPRESLPLVRDEFIFEVRLLTVLKAHRGTQLASLLMYAALRWVEAHGGKRIVAIGRREVLDLYLRTGLKPVGFAVEAGAVTYDLLAGEVRDMQSVMQSFGGLIARLEEKTDWQLAFPFRRPANCFHGGAFFSAIGPAFEALERKDTVISADVLDAWFPPAPGVIESLQKDLAWLLRTSPPTDCQGFIETVARARGVAPLNILPGAGSSDLIFRAFTNWLDARSHVLILNPTYGEYSHVLENVIGCTVDRFLLAPEMNWQVDLHRLERTMADGYDLVVLVNPNSPTGQHIPRAALQRLLERTPQRTRVWLDETYVEYAGADESLESFAAQSENVIVGKSMSKVYALSGARAAYLCAGPHQLESLRARTPPWVLSLPAQLAAVRALQDPNYYQARYAETHQLREALAVKLREIGFEVFPGRANFLLCQLPETAPAAAGFVRQCRAQDLFVRDAAAMGSNLGERSIRIAVKDEATNDRMIQIIRDVLACSDGS